MSNEMEQLIELGTRLKQEIREEAKGKAYAKLKHAIAKAIDDEREIIEWFKPIDGHEEEVKGRERTLLLFIEAYEEGTS